MRYSILALTVLCLALAGGCSPKISAAKVDSLRLRETDEKEMKALFGEPKDLEAYSDTHGSSVVCTYVNTGGTAIGPYRIVMAEGIILEIRDYKLNGYIYFSNDGENATKIDAEAAKSVKVGQTTQADVLKLLGKPAGKMLVPSRLPDMIDIARPGTSEVWAYTMADKLNGWVWSDVSMKLMLVAFNTNGSVVEVGEKTVTRKMH